MEEKIITTSIFLSWNFNLVFTFFRAISIQVIVFPKPMAAMYAKVAPIPTISFYHVFYKKSNLILVEKIFANNHTEGIY